MIEVHVYCDSCGKDAIAYAIQRDVEDDWWDYPNGWFTNNEPKTGRLQTACSEKCVRKLNREYRKSKKTP